MKEMARWAPDIQDYVSSEKEETSFSVTGSCMFLLLLALSHSHLVIEAREAVPGGEVVYAYFVTVVILEL